MTSFPFDPDYVVAPGETLKDWFVEQDLPHTLSGIYGIPPDQLVRLLEGDEPITEGLAENLQRLTRVSAGFWLAMEHNFRVGLAAGKKWSGRELG